MAVKEYQWQRATDAQLRKCVKWCQNQFQLRDWDIHLMLGGDPPNEILCLGEVWDEEDDGGRRVFGKACIKSCPLKQAYVWLNLSLIEKDNKTPYGACIHEMIHVFQVSPDRDMEEKLAEQMAYTLEPLLYRLFCMDNKIKISDEVKF